MEFERGDSELRAVLRCINEITQFSHQPMFEARKHRRSTNDYDVFS